MDQPNALFVYGSLQPGAENEGYLKHFKGSWKQAYVLGNLVTEGWGSQIGFPAIKIDRQGAKVHGWLLVSDDLSSNWQMLDEFEGDEYKRSVTDIYCEDGSVTKAFVYELADKEE